MWNRQEVKQRAKGIMKRNYWKMFVIALLASILTGEGVSTVSSVQDIADNFSPDMQTTILTIGTVGSLLGLVYTIFVGNVIRVGKAAYFIQNQNENPPLNMIFSAFKGNYMNVVKIMVVMYIKNFLWFLLFIIPGIMKAYEYSMIPYILAENPDISMDEAFAQTRNMTTGQKMDLFVLDLSFLGWILLGGICCGVGILFVQPYIEATMVEVYTILKENR